MMTHTAQIASTLLTMGLLAVGPVTVACAAAQTGLPAPDDVAEPPDDADRTSSGLASKVLQAGTGSAHPSASNQVTVHYTGWLENGQMFDSSVVRGAPATFPLNQVIAGWTEGVQLMVVGEKRRFWIPSELGYGAQGAGNAIPPGADLVFDVELLEIR